MKMYIYQQEGWPKFHWNQEALAGVLAAVRHRQGRLLGRMEGLGFPLRKEATFRSLTEEVIKSSAIEGEILNQDQVRASLACHLGMDIGALTPADHHVEGVVEMILDATEKFSEPLTAERLFAWHADLFPGGRNGLRRITAGGWRDDKTGPMQVVSGLPNREHVHYEAPGAARLNEEMKTFLEWFNATSNIDPVLKAAIAHLWFVTIHPFEDGNGRIARAIADMALARSESTAQRFYSMSSQIRQERNAYYEILERTQKGDLDITAWLEWFLGCLDRAFAQAEISLSGVLRKSRFWAAHAATHLNDRQRLMLNRLLDGFEGKLTSSKWAKITKTSQDTAGRDIDELVKLDILIKDAAGGRSTSYSLAAIDEGEG